MTPLLRELVRDTRGGVGALSVLVCVLVLSGSAAAIDASSVYFHARALQGLADTAAVSAAGDLARPAQTAARVLEIKGSNATIGAVETGEYRPDATLSLADRFIRGTGASNAVRVVLEEEVSLFFGQVLGMRSVRIRKSAVATRPAREAAAFSIGSRLLSAEPALANALLSGLTGQEIALTAVGYDGLVRSNLDVDALLADLGDRLGVADRTALLGRELSTHQLVDSLSGVTDGQTSVTLRSIAAAIDQGQDRRLRLDSLIEVSPLVAGELDAQVPVWDLLLAALGDAANAETITLNADIAAPLTATVRLSIGERQQQSPWLTVESEDTIVVRTAQIRLHVDVATPDLAGLGRVRLPLYAEVASGEASLASIDCRNKGFAVTANSGVASLALGEISTSRLSDYSREAVLSPAPILDTVLLRVRGSARINVGSSGPTRLQFSRSDIESLTPKTIGSGNLLASSLGSLTSSATLDIQVLGLGVSLGGLPSRIRNALLSIVSPLDEVLSSVLDLVGVGIGEADIRPAGLLCGSGGSPRLAA
jgi:uncharacterized membrane protein